MGHIPLYRILRGGNGISHFLTNHRNETALRTFFPVGVFVIGIIFLLGCQAADHDDSTSPPTRDSLLHLSDKIKNNPKSDQAFLDRAQYYYHNRSYDAALKDLEAALDLDSTRMETYILKSQVEMDYFRSLESLRTLEKAERLWPESLLVKENLAQTLLILKQYDKAEEKSVEALELNPGAARPYLYLGLIARDKQDSTLAMEYLHQAVQNDADLLDAWVELARIQMEENPREAAPYFESALQIAPDEILIWHAYAMFWERQDSLERAIDTYDHMVGLDPDYHEAYYNQALILMDQDSFHRALPLWDQYIILQPESARGYFYRGICFELTENFSNAHRDYRKAKDLDSGLPNIDQALESMEKKMARGAN